MGDIGSYSPTYASLPPFPDDARTAPLVTLSLAKLEVNDSEESTALFKCGKELGFFYLNLTGSRAGELLFNDAQSLLHLMEKFYALPDEEKRIADRNNLTGGNGYYGYKAIGTTVMDRNGTRDKSELYNLKKDDIVGNTTPLPAPQLVRDNMPLLESYARNAHSIIILMLNIFNEHLGLPEGTLANLHRLTSESGDHVRMKHAPAMGLGNGEMSAAAHTDFGSLTILFNWLGGLQVQLPGETEWVYVRPVPGCAIVNLGDAMVKFTAGLLRSNIHRTMNPPGKQGDQERYSLVYFSRPENTVPLVRLKGGVIDAQPRSNTPEDTYTAQEWIMKRGLATKARADFKPEDWDKSRGTEGNRG